MSDRAMQTCFISAPAGSDLSVLREALAARGMRILAPPDLWIGKTTADGILALLEDADIVIGVLDSSRASTNVMFELGMAVSRGGRILILASPELDLAGLSAYHLLVLRVDPTNREAIDFALDQIVTAPKTHRPRPFRPSSQKHSSLGSRTDALIAEIDRFLDADDFRGLESTVAEIIRESGADIVVESPGHDRGVDLAVWSDALANYVGNPILVEVKARISNRQQIRNAVNQLSRYLEATNAHWALLVYGAGPPAGHPAWSLVPGNVIALSVKDLAESLRNQTFPEMIRDIRNMRTHGASS